MLFIRIDTVHPAAITSTLRDTHTERSCPPNPLFTGELTLGQELLGDPLLERYIGLEPM